MFWGQLVDFLSLVPQAVLQFVLAVIGASVSVLFSFEPSSRIGLLVGHHIDSIALTLVQLVEALIASAVWIFLHAKPIHFLVNPVTCVFFAVRPPVGSKSLDKAILVHARVSLTIRPFLDTVSISLVVLVVSKELRTIWIGLFAFADHGSFAEHALVNEEVHVSRRTLAMVHVVGPLSLIRLTGNLSVFSVAMGVT